MRYIIFNCSNQARHTVPVVRINGDKVYYLMNGKESVILFSTLMDNQAKGTVETLWS